MHPSSAEQPNQNDDQNYQRNNSADPAVGSVAVPTAAAKKQK
jgi:hypothetical protein